jgi:hypothetical protein
VGHAESFLHLDQHAAGEGQCSDNCSNQHQFLYRSEASGTCTPVSYLQAHTPVVLPVAAVCSPCISAGATVSSGACTHARVAALHDCTVSRASAASQSSPAYNHVRLHCLTFDDDQVGGEVDALCECGSSAQHLSQ